MLIIGTLGLYVFYKNPQSSLNRAFFWFVVPIVIWDFIDYNFIYSPTREVAYWWSLGYTIIPLCTTTEVIFFQILTESKDLLKFTFWNALNYLGTIIVLFIGFIALAYYPALIQENGHWSQVADASFAAALWDGILTIWGGILIVYVYYRSWKYYRTLEDPVKKKQMIVIFWTCIISMVLDAFQAVGWFGHFQPPEIAYYSISVLTAGMAFAIIRFDMFALNASSAAESIISTMKDGVLLLTPDKRITLANAGFEQISGYQFNELVGKQLKNLISIGNHKVSKKEHDATLFAKKEDIPISMVTSKFISSKGILRGIVVIVRDIRDRKAQEVKLAESYAEIKAADAQIRVEVSKLHTILESVGEGLIVVNEKGHIAMVNQGGKELLECNEKEFVGKEFVRKFVLVNDKGEEIDLHKQLTLLNTDTPTMHYSLADSIYIRINEHKKVPVIMSISRVPFDKKSYGYVVVFDNATKDMAIDKAKTEFVSLAAHQLRVPITAMKWNLEMASDLVKERNEKNILDLLQISANQADNMADLVEQFLNVSRIELGKLAVTPVMLNLANVINEVIAEQKMQAEKKSQKLVINLADKIPAIPLDKTLIRVVIQNLLSNAIKYTPDKGTVSVLLETKETYARIIFADNGMGIPKHQQKELFNKLFRADNAVASGQEGNGLGLYLVKEVVQIAQGNISFVSEVNKGTTFTVTIPYKGMQPRAGSRTLSS